jgi:hypothetical protein
MRRHVVQLARAVAGGGDRLAVSHQDRADRNLAARARRLRFAKRLIHEARRACVHLASSRPV